MADVQTYDLRSLTQRQYIAIGTQIYNSGGLTTFRLPEIGLASRLFLTFSGSLVVALNTGTATFSALGVGSFASTIRIRLNDGTILYEMDGFNTPVCTELQNGFVQNNTSVARNFTGITPWKSPAAGAVLTSATTAILQTFEIPFVNNDKDLLGLILLQNGTTQATVEIVWNPTMSTSALAAPVVVTGNATATFTGQVIPTLEFFSVPNISDPAILKEVLRPHLSWVNVWRSEYEAITSNATFTKKLERGSIYTKIAHRIILNGVPDSTPVNNLRILMKGTESPTSIIRDLQLYLQRRNYAFDLADGLYVHDFDRSYGIEAFGDHRDYIDSRQLTELVSEISYLSSMTPTASTSFMYTISNKLTPVSY